MASIFWLADPQLVLENSSGLYNEAREKVFMAVKARAKLGPLPTIGKAATGIRGLDDVTQGGLPQGRPTLLCGAPAAARPYSP